MLLMKNSAETSSEQTSNLAKKVVKRVGVMALGTTAALTLMTGVANAENSHSEKRHAVTATASPSPSASPSETASPEASPSLPPLSSDDDSHMVIPSVDVSPSLPPLSSDNDSQMVNRPTTPELPHTGPGFPVEEAALLGGALVAAGAAAQAAGARKQ
jgi:hypothetical protein